MSERRRRTTRIVLLSSVVVLTTALASLATTDVQGSGNGKAVLRFGGPGLTATLSGNLSLTGAWVEGSQTIPFVAQGTILGSGEWSLATFAGAAWATFRARGTAAQTESIEICGALSVASGDAQRIALGVVIFAARFVLVVHRTSGDLAYAGSATGQLVGGFVVPEIPYTMQANGSVSLNLVGEPIASPLTGLDWTATPSDAVWPDEVSRRLLGALGWTSPPAQAANPGG